MTQRLSTWFVTEKGKQFTFGLTCATTISIFSAYTLPNTWLLEKYKNIIHLYKFGISVKVPSVVLNRFNTALDLLEISSVERKLIKPFTVFGFDIFNAGTIYSKFGGLVGIPINYSYNNVDEINKQDIMVNNEPANWSTDEGQQLLNSLVLSENAQLFAIAREISTIKSVKLFLDTFYGTSTFIAMYGLGNSLNNKFNLYSRPISLRLVLYSLIGFFGFGVYALLTDATQVYFDKKIDKNLSEKNPIFVEGGKEFYEKLIQRNIALRKLMGSSGIKKFTALGNENYFIRQKALPLIVRRDFFANKIQHVT